MADNHALPRNVRVRQRATRRHPLLPLASFSDVPLRSEERLPKQFALHIDFLHHVSFYMEEFSSVWVSQKTSNPLPELHVLCIEFGPCTWLVYLSRWTFMHFCWNAARGKPPSLVIELRVDSMHTGLAITSAATSRLVAEKVCSESSSELQQYFRRRLSPPELWFTICGGTWPFSEPQN